MPKQFQGTIVSDKMQKTRTVLVESSKEHPRYKKRVRVRKRFKAHDEKEEYHVGDRVVIQETRPLSKDKRWVILHKA